MLQTKRDPPDEPHYHEPDDEAILLGMTDEPILRSMNFYAEAAIDE